VGKEDELVTAIIHVHQSWVETTGASAIFASANVALGQGDILGIPVTRWDISDEYSSSSRFIHVHWRKNPSSRLRS
jgi:hypothetical protein